MVCCQGGIGGKAASVRAQSEPKGCDSAKCTAPSRHWCGGGVWVDEDEQEDPTKNEEEDKDSGGEGGEQRGGEGCQRRKRRRTLRSLSSRRRRRYNIMRRREGEERQELTCDDALRAMSVANNTTWVARNQMQALRFDWERLNSNVLVSWIEALTPGR